MSEFIIDDDGGPSLRFTGSMLAHVSSQNPDAPRSRWTELSVYVTNRGRFVGSQVGRSTLEGEVDRYSADVFDTLDEVIRYFGHGRLAKRLYEAANIPDVREV